MFLNGSKVVHASLSLLCVYARVDVHAVKDGKNVGTSIRRII